MHLEHRLCNRCTQFVGREVERRATRPWITGGAAGAASVVGMLAAGVAAGVLIALPVAAGVLFAHRVLQRRSLIRRMGPALAASKGELPPEPRNTDRFPEAGTMHAEGP